MEKEKAEQLENIRLMNEWKKKQEEKEKESSATNTIIEKMRLDQARLRQELDESANSSSLSAPKAFLSKEKPPEESYTSDDFEDVSISGSGSKNLTSMSGKGMSKAKIDDSLKSSTSGYSMSNSKSIGGLKSNSQIAESSDVYEDDEFESVSKSHKEMQKLLPTVAKLETLKSIGNATKSPMPQPTTAASIAQTYARKENKQTMTDQGKYNYMGASDAAPNNLKEFTLSKNLEEAEHLI